MRIIPNPCVERLIPWPASWLSQWFLAVRSAVFLVPRTECLSAAPSRKRPRCSTLHLNWNVLSSRGLQTRPCDGLWRNCAAWITRFLSRYCGFLFRVSSRLRQKPPSWFQVRWSRCGERPPRSPLFGSSSASTHAQQL